MLAATHPHEDRMIALDWACLQWPLDTTATGERGKLTILAAGDLAPLGRPEAELRKGNVQTVFNSVLPIIAESDLSIANLECPLTSSRSRISKTGPHLQAHPGVGSALHKAGFTAFTLANNHILDYGEDGVRETISTLEANHLRYCGVGPDHRAASKPLFIEKKGYRVAILSLAEHEFNWQGRNQWGTWPLQPAENVLQIQAARRQADIVLVFVHGGLEYTTIPSPRLISTCRAFAESGAHAVIGHHAHCVMGLEVHRGIPIAYNLGDFLFDLPEMHPKGCCKTGLLLRLTLESGNRVSMSCIPTYLNPQTGCIRLLSVEQFVKFRTYFQRLCVVLEDSSQAESLWRLFCISRMNSYLGNVLKATIRASPELLYRALESWLFKHNSSSRLFPGTAKGVNLLRALLLCESHHEAISSIIETIRTGSLTRCKNQLALLDPYLDLDINCALSNSNLQDG
jgi:poly-gamma-glutamate synthesis protein (capsule biosynthesis protein)